MKTRLAVLGLLLSGACAGTSHAADCVLSRLASLDAVVDGNALVIPVTVHGEERRVMFTTASAVNIMTEDLARQLGLPSHLLPSNADIELGGRRVLRSVKLDSIEVGKVNFANVELALAPAAYAQQLPKGVGAVLGISLFNSVDIELDLHNGKIALYSEQNCSGKGAYWTRQAVTLPLHWGSSDTLYFPVELDGKRVEATFSTQSSTSTLEEVVSRKVYGLDEDSPGWQTRLDPVTFRPAHYRAMRVTAGGVQVADPQVALAPSSRGCKLAVDSLPDHAAGYLYCADRYPLVLGRDVLTQLHVYLAGPEGAVYLSSASAD